MDAVHTFDVIPPTVDVPSTATLPLVFDISPWVETGDVPSLPSAKLVRNPQRSEKANSISSVVLVGNLVTVVVTALEPEQEYHLLVSVRLGTSKVPTGVLRIRCPL